FSSRRRHTRSKRDWSSDVCSSDLNNSISQRIDSSNNIRTTRILIRLSILILITNTHVICKTLRNCRSTLERISKPNRRRLEPVGAIFCIGKVNNRSDLRAKVLRARQPIIEDLANLGCSVKSTIGHIRNGLVDGITALGKTICEALIDIGTHIEEDCARRMNTKDT